MKYHNYFIAALLVFFVVFNIAIAQDTTVTVTESKVGIGVTQPLERLHINGSLQLDKTGPELNRLILKTVSQNDPGRYGIQFSNNLLAPFLGDDISDQHFDFYSKWGNQRTYDAVLSIHGKADGSWGKVLRLTHDGTDGYITTDTGNLIFNPSGGEANVAIGLTDPSATLHVSSNGGFTNPQALLQQTGGDGFTRLRFINSSDQSWDIAGSPDNQLRFFSGSSGDLLTLTSTARVGIGTLDPVDKFEVEGGQFTLDGAGGLLAFRMRQNDSLRWTMLSAPWIGNDLRIRNEVTATDVLVFDRETNNIGINTNTPMGTLDVNGTIYQRGLSIHADYVFEADYQLETIEDHANYMWHEKHLKAIPKSSVDENGREIVEVGSHRKGIVEELEKAHIYIEQLNNRIKSLETKLEEAITAINEDK